MASVGIAKNSFVIICLCFRILLYYLLSDISLDWEKIKLNSSKMKSSVDYFLFNIELSNHISNLYSCTYFHVHWLESGFLNNILHQTFTLCLGKGKEKRLEVFARQLSCKTNKQFVCFSCSVISEGAHWGDHSLIRRQNFGCYLCDTLCPRKYKVDIKQAKHRNEAGRRFFWSLIGIFYCLRR